MSQVNDCIFKALTDRGHLGHINDMMLQYYLANGAVTENINDAQFEFLINVGATPAALNDMWFEVLRLQGYTGALMDMWYEFWCVAGGSAGPGSPIPTTADFLAAFNAYTPTQAEGLSGNVCSLMPIGTLTSAAVHADPILALDHEGIYREFAANEMVVRGGRVVISEALWSEDMTNAAWLVYDGATKPAANNIILTSAAASQVYQSKMGALAGETYTVSAKISSNTGTDQKFRMRCVVNPTGPALTATTTPQIFTTTGTVVVDGNADFGVFESGAGVGADLIVDWIQVENTTGRADTTTPSEYMATTTAAVAEVFSTLNGNTVLNNVVTEATGVDITPHPWLQSNAAGTNRVVHSNNLVDALWVKSGTPIVTFDQVGITGEPNTASRIEDDDVGAAEYGGEQVTGSILGDVARIYVLKEDDETSFPDIDFMGSSITLNKKTGAWKNRDKTPDVEVVDGGLWWVFYIRPLESPHITLNCIPAITSDWGVAVQNSAVGHVIIGNIEVLAQVTIEEAKALSPIITTTVARTISATNYNHNLANVDTDNSATALEFVAEGESFDILTIGSQVLLSYGDVPSSTESVTDGGFDDPAQWAPHPEWDISGGTAQITDPTAARNLAQVVNPAANALHDVTVEILELPATRELRVVLGLGLGVDFTASLGVQTVQVMSAAGANLELKPNGSDTGTLRIDNVSVREIVKGLILDDGTTRTTYPIAVGDHMVGIALGESALNANIVTNGLFDNGDGWAIGSGWEISGGSLNMRSGIPGNITHAIGAVAGQLYEIEVHVSNRVGSYVNFYLGGSVLTTLDTNGIITFRGVCGGAEFGDIRMYTNGGTSGSYDILTVRAVVSTIQLTIDGVAQTERSYTPIAQGLIDVDATHWLLRSELMLSYANAQARIASWLS